ncbi:MAG: phosphoadenosine phosphosulfate reductase family protein [Hymenobacter sp.]
MKYIIGSFSGGRTSAYLLRLLLSNYPVDTLRFVFANTGMERPETLEFIHECCTRWGIHVTYLEAVVHPQKGIATGYREVTHETAYRPEYCWNPNYGKELGLENPFYEPRYAAMHASRPAEWVNPFEAVIAKYGIPNNSFPHCSRELKAQPIGAWIKEYFAGKDFQMALGIRADEAEREGDWWYPLIGWGVTKAQVRQFWREQPFDLQLKDYEGNCDLCWKKGHNKNLTLLEEHPILGLFWAQMEAKYGHTTPADGDRRRTKAMAPLPLLDTLDGIPAKRVGPYYFNHNAVSVAALYAMSKRGRFKRIRDEEEVRSCACGVEFETLARELKAPQITI